MAVKEFPAGTQLIQSEQNQTGLHVIAKGSVCASYPGGTFYLKKGDVIGVCEIFFGSHFITYETEEPTGIASYPCTAAQLSLLMSKSVDLANMIVSSLFRQFREIYDQYELMRFDCENIYHFLMDRYEEYKSFCVKHGFTPRALPDMEDLTPLTLEEDLEGWLDGYYEQMTLMVTQKSSKFHKPDFLAGVVLKADLDIHRIISICRVFYDDIEHSMETILSYAEVDVETAAAFRESVDKFAKMTDKNASDDAARKLRMTITKQFYVIYEKAFVKSLKDTASIPKVVRMFFNFGYIDENLAGLENASYLYSIIDKIPSDPKRKVYTAYEWFAAIYKGEKVPSRNEFDSDFPTFLREQKMTGNITAEDEARMLNDPLEQVLFEIRNMFPTVNKITFGRVLSFCPVFSEHNVLKELDSTLVSAEKVEESFQKIRDIDFSAYYRDVIYTNPDIGIGKETVSVEVLPDIILMPNVGTRGIAWQEIEGRKRTTPARMMVSIFQLEDLTNILVRLTGDFRWEMCKRVQGARWNDISEASLTSEYFDYIQFYRKNHELSADAKDKIKLNMKKAKNSYKEMFIMDYEAWILYEGAGSPRLNKVSRNIIFTYCPFSKAIRTKLMANPLYKETMSRYDIKLSQKLHHYDNVFQKLKNTGTPIPQELQMQRDYLCK